MTTFQLLLGCLTALGLATIAAAAFVVVRWGSVREPAEAPPRVGRRVTVHTKQPDDHTIFGVLVGDHSDRLVLEHAEFVTPTGARPIPGVQHVATRDVAWIDVHALVAGGAPAGPSANGASAAVARDPA